MIILLPTFGGATIVLPRTFSVQNGRAFCGLLVTILLHTTLEHLQCCGNDVALHEISKLVVQNGLDVQHIRSACWQIESFENGAAIIGNEVAPLENYHARAIHVRKL